MSFDEGRAAWRATPVQVPLGTVDRGLLRRGDEPRHARSRAKHAKTARVPAPAIAAGLLGITATLIPSLAMAGSQQHPEVVQLSSQVLSPPAASLPPPVFAPLDRPASVSHPVPLPVATPTGARSISYGRAVPGRVLVAYQDAVDRLRLERPSCGVTWPLLAAIGFVESGHGSFGGAGVDVDGVVAPRIIGPRLDGVGDVAEVLDSDGGRLDGDARYDHAVGPMQFLPSTWARGNADGDRDGISDPQDMDDAAYAAASYLCASGSLKTQQALVRAVFRYNHSQVYVAEVLALQVFYSGDPMPTVPVRTTGPVPSTTTPPAAFSPHPAPTATATPAAPARTVPPPTATPTTTPEATQEPASPDPTSTPPSP